MAEGELDVRINVTEAADFTGNIVKVLVGKDEKIIQVHESTLRTSSPFFDSALKECWQERSTKEVKLPEVSADIFHTYVRYLYSGSIACKNKDINKDYDTLTGLYALGERLLDNSLRDNVLVAIMATWKEDQSKRDPNKSGCLFPGALHINQIYNTTTEGSPARRLLVDTYVLRARSTWSSLNAGANMCHEFVLDLTKALLDMREVSASARKPLIARLSGISCAYHHHKEGEPCPTKRDKLA